VCVCVSTKTDTSSSTTPTSNEYFTYLWRFFLLFSLIPLSFFVAREFSEKWTRGRRKIKEEEFSFSSIRLTLDALRVYIIYRKKKKLNKIMVNSVEVWFVFDKRRNLSHFLFHEIIYIQFLMLGCFLGVKNRKTIFFITKALSLF
jgi:hypothetical protein